MIFAQIIILQSEMNNHICRSNRMILTPIVIHVLASPISPVVNEYAEKRVEVRATVELNPRNQNRCRVPNNIMYAKK
jgi:hypothetical protein